MKQVDTSVFVASKLPRIAPEEVDLGQLPIIEKRKPMRPQKPASDSNAGIEVKSQPLSQMPAITSKAGSPPLVPASPDEFVLQLLEWRSDSKMTFRFPKELTYSLDEIERGLRRRLKRKFHKNAIAVLSISYILKDYQLHGDESILAKLASKASKPATTSNAGI